jgi:hypothetical protein
VPQVPDEAIRDLSRAREDNAELVRRGYAQVMTIPRTQACGALRAAPARGARGGTRPVGAPMSPRERGTGSQSAYTGMLSRLQRLAKALDVPVTELLK